MKKYRKVLLSFFALMMIAAFSFLSGPAMGKVKFAKDTGKKCAFCHEGKPKKGGKLTKNGECFKKNGNKKGDCW